MKYDDFRREVIAEMAHIHAMQSPHWTGWDQAQRDHYERLLRGNVAMHKQVDDVLQAVMAVEERFGLAKR